MKQRYFVTGTDTEVGKTYVTARLLNDYQQQGISCLGLKPIASGAVHTEEGLRNEDALILQQAASIKLPYDQVNPICLEPAVAPNIAANNQLSVTSLVQSLQWIHEHPAEVILIEGSGGWLLPLNQQQTMAEVVQALRLTVILVVRIRLGCLNHTLLTIENIQAKQIPIKGWIANIMDPTMECLEENIETLQNLLSVPLLKRYDIEPTLSNF